MNTNNRAIIFFIVILLAGIGKTAFAQTGIERDTTAYLDSELYEDRSETPVYRWLGGGFSVGYFTPNLDAFNTNIARPFVGEDVKNTVILYGGQGFIPFPWVENLRVGGMGYGGQTEICCQDYVASSGQDLTRSLKYSLGYGGLMLDYALPLGIDQFNILAGVELGLGGVEIEAIQAANRTSFDIETDFNTPSVNITHTYSSSFFMYKPRVIFEFAPTNFLMLDLSVGYQGTSMGTWKVDGDVGLGDTQKLNDINGSGFIVHFGINVGFFQ